jgi:selenocysteine lyase/cysteine desulfurase
VLGSLVSVQRAFAEELDGRRLERLRSGTLQGLRDEYMLGDGVTYLNHASIGTVPRLVHEARVEYLTVCESNPWLYMWGGAWEEPREEVRGKVARLMGCKPEGVTITHNTTEAFNLLSNGLPLGPGDEVVFSSLNHTGASAAFFHAARTRGFDVTRFQFPLADVTRMSDDDVVQVHDRHITSRTKLLVFPHLDNMVGLRHPVAALARMARQRGVEFVAVDAAQTVGMFPVDMDEYDVDCFATSPHKWLQAPKGLGLAYFSPAIQEVLKPMWVTWGQNRWEGTARVYEDYGTRNLAETLTLGDAIDFQNRIDAVERERRLQELFAFTMKMADENPSTEWVSPRSWEQSGSLYGVSIRGKESNQLFGQMYERHGLVFRPFNTQGLDSVRLSPNIFDNEDEIARFFEIATG